MPLPVGYLRAQGVVPWNDRQGTVVSIDGQLVTEKFTNVLTLDADGVGADLGPAAAGTADLTIDGALASGGVATFDFARRVAVIVTHDTSIVAVSGTVYGYDIYGNAIQEAWSVTATGTSKTYTTGKAFKKVTRVTITAAADASGDTITVGTTKSLGLAYVALDQAIIGELEDSSVPTAGALVAGSTATLTDYRGIYTPNSAPDDSKDFTISYRCNVAIEQFKGSTA